MAKLTEAQEQALRRIKANGVEYAYNGISRATVAVLERHGLVTVKWSVHTWTSRRNYRNHSQCEWAARPAEEALSR